MADDLNAYMRRTPDYPIHRRMDAVHSILLLERWLADGRVPEDVAALCFSFLDPLPPGYEAQVAAYRATGRSGLAAFDGADVIRSSGARGLWRHSGAGWEQVDRCQAAQVAAIVQRRAEGERPAWRTGRPPRTRMAEPRLRRQGGRQR